MQNDLESIGDKTDKEEQGIFESRFNSLIDEFGQACEDHNVPFAFIALINPEIQSPVIFARGHAYDVAVMLHKILNKMKSELYHELEDFEPNS
jgi:hypothetical protein